MLAPYLRKVAELSSAMGATHLLRDIPHCQRNETLSQMAKFDRTTSRPSCFISERVAMWQSHWQPRRNPLPHKDLRCVDSFANPGKVGKELDGERTRPAGQGQIVLSSLNAPPSKGRPALGAARSWHRSNFARRFATRSPMLLPPPPCSAR